MLTLLSLINIINWVNMPKLPKVPFGFTAFGAGSVATSIYLSYPEGERESDKAKKVADDSKEQLDELIKGQKALTKEVQEVKNEVQEVKNTTTEINQKIDNCNKLINNFSIPSITEAFQKSVEFFSQFDLFTQCLIFNIITSFSLLNLLYAFFLSKYGNYLIEKFNLEAKYPKLSRFFKARLFFQNYYYKYITVLAILFLLNSLFINLYLLLG
uniref:hypothetical protein n=1 Tax=Trametes maxima TaxID=259368 RepID=UPI0030034127|nr:hypothetical protein [Trametes maxima]